MARPKVKSGSWSSAFDEKCVREKERLRQKLANELREDMLRLLEEGLESDLTVLTSSGQTNLHRCIIKKRCPQLLTDLLDDPAEGSTVKLHSVNLDSFNQIIRFIYTEDDLTPIEHTLQELIRDNQLTHRQSDADADSISTTAGDPTTSHITHTQEDRQDILNGNFEAKSSDEVTEPVVTAKSQGKGGESVNGDSRGARGKERNGEGEEEKEGEEGERNEGACCTLARDLLEMLNTGEDADMVLTSGDQSVKCHRCILSVRSDYFSAMLGGSWRESSATQINLEGLSERALNVLTEFVYGRMDSDFLLQCPLVETAMISDMYALHGLKHVVGFLLRRDKCHFFHKPCSGCLSGVLEILPMCHTYLLQDVWDRALKWITRHFVRTWPLKHFSGLPEDIRQICLDAAIADITSDSVLEMIIDCDCLMGSLSNVRWSEPVVVMATGLMDACIQHLRNNLAVVVTSDKFNSLGSTMALGLGLLEDVFSRAILTMPRDKICESYHAVHQLALHSESEHCIWNGDFRKLVDTLNSKCEHYVRLHINSVVHTEAWKTLITPDMQEKIKEGVWYVCVGDTGPVRSPPKLTSTTQRNGGRRVGRSAVGSRVKSAGPASVAGKRTTQPVRFGRPAAVTTTTDQGSQQSRSKVAADRSRSTQERLPARSAIKTKTTTAKPAKETSKCSQPKQTLNCVKVPQKSNKSASDSDRDVHVKESAIPVLQHSSCAVSFLANFTGPLPFNFQCLEKDNESGSVVSLLSNRATVNSNLSTPSSVSPSGSGSYEISVGSDVFSSESRTPDDPASSATLPLVPLTDLAVRCNGLIFIEEGFVPLLTWDVQAY